MEIYAHPQDYMERCLRQRAKCVPDLSFLPNILPFSSSEVTYCQIFVCLWLSIWNILNNYLTKFGSNFKWCEPICGYFDLKTSFRYFKDVHSIDPIKIWAWKYLCSDLLLWGWIMNTNFWYTEKGPGLVWMAELSSPPYEWHHVIIWTI